MLSKIFSLGLTSLVGLALATTFQPEPPGDGPPPPPRTKKKDAPPPPEEGLRKTYETLRRLRSDYRTTGRPEERLRDWTDRATALYREAVKAEKAGNGPAAHEYGVAANDLARAVELARSAAQYDRPDATADPDLPPPPSGPNPEGDKQRVVRDLERAHDHIRDQLDKDDPGKDAKFYNEASRDLYNAARRDVEAGRIERGGELARAAEAMSHVNEHLAHATGQRPNPPEGDDGPEAKTKPEPKQKKKKGVGPEKKKRPEPKGDRPEPRGDRPAGELPPPL